VELERAWKATPLSSTKVGPIGFYRLESDIMVQGAR
jgi:hypothetical protein